MGKIIKFVASPAFFREVHHLMGLLDLLLHLANFIAPALALALLLPLAGRLVYGRRPMTPAWWLQVLVNVLVGGLTLALGLWFFGRDGKMAAYGALIFTTASSQWLLSRA